jgi:C4-dicarboxylate transporter DctM subunit
MVLFFTYPGPYALKVGVHPFQHGILIIIICNIGILTPPIGFVLFAFEKFTGDNVWPLSLEMLPFLILNVMVVLIVAFSPNVTLWLPRIFGSA